MKNILSVGHGGSEGLRRAATAAAAIVGEDRIQMIAMNANTEYDGLFSHVAKIATNEHFLMKKTDWKSEEVYTHIGQFLNGLHTATWKEVKSGKLQKADGVFWKTREFTLEVTTDGSDCRLSWTSQGDAKVEAGYRKVIHKKGMNVGGIAKDGTSMGRNGKFRLPLTQAAGDLYTNNKKGYYFYSPVSREDRDDWVNKLQEYCA
jgi:hypothetical protein